MVPVRVLHKQSSGHAQPSGYCATAKLAREISAVANPRRTKAIFQLNFVFAYKQLHGMAALCGLRGARALCTQSAGQAGYYTTMNIHCVINDVASLTLICVMQTQP